MSKPHVIDVTEANFEAEVLERSYRHPVIVDLWAEWCGPCKTLSPVLEGLAAEGDGQWTLAKIDVDGSPYLAQQFQAQSIPLVVAVYQGQLVHQFAGAQPKAQVERWLQAIFQAIGLKLAPKAVEVPVPTDPAQAEVYWREKLAKNQDDHKARLELGRLFLTSARVADAETILNAIPGSAPEFGAAQAALALRGLVQVIGEAGGEAAIAARAAGGESTAELSYLQGLVHGANGRFADALALLVGLVGSQKEPLRGQAHKAASLILEAAGRNDEAVEVQRKRLTRLLF
jgi:putative thioredoxin